LGSVTGVSCLDENLALDFLSGTMSPAAVAEAESHLAECGACVDLIAASAQLLRPRLGRPAPLMLAETLRARVAAAASGMDQGADTALSASELPEWRRPPSGSPPGAGQELDDGGMPGVALLPGTVVKDTYQVLRLVGRGGMGEVYEVSHARLAGRYALKLLPKAIALDPAAFTRFRREAEITSALRHPGIVQVIDFDYTPEGQPFLVMEYLQGGDLGQLMASVGPMPLGRVLTIVGQIASALGAVHRQGIVHRDLKPQNVLIVRDDDEPPLEGPQDRVKLADFGLSKRRQGSLFDLGSASVSRERTLLGTPHYMAPEQAAGQIDDIDASTDQFALAAMTYEMLAGVPAFNDEHLTLVLYKIVREEPAPLQRLCPDVPDHVTEALKRAMSKQRAARFPSIGEFVEALRGPEALFGPDWVRGALPSSLSSSSSSNRVSAPPVSTEALLPARAGGRRRWAAGAAAALALAAIVVVAATNVGRSPTESSGAVVPAPAVPFGERARQAPPAPAAPSAAPASGAASTEAPSAAVAVDPPAPPPAPPPVPSVSAPASVAAGRGGARTRPKRIGRAAPRTGSTAVAANPPSAGPAGVGILIEDL
jgi:eukaryotic-like serine/threonine-protein kinase